MLKKYIDLPRSVHILCLGSFVNRAGSMIVPFLTIYLQQELDLGVSFATWAMGAYGAGSLVAALVGGQLADLVGRRIVMLFAMFGSGTVLVIFSLLSAPWMLLLASFCFALVAETYRPAASAMIADVTEPEDRPHAFSLMYVAINLGFAVAPVVGGLLVAYSYQWLFWGDALTSALYAVIILVAIQETLPGRTNKLAKGDGAGFPIDASAPAAPTVSLSDALRHISHDYTLVMFCAATLALAGVYMQAMSTFPLHLAQLGIGPKTYGQMIAVNGIMIATVQIPLTSAVARFNRGNVVIFGALFTAVGFGLFGFASSIWQFVVCIMIWTIGEMMIAPFGAAIVSDLAPKAMRARYMGVFTTCFSSALMFAVPLGGLILERWGGGYVWAACFASGLVAAMLYFSIRHQIGVPSNRLARETSSEPS